MRALPSRSGGLTSTVVVRDVPGLTRAKDVAALRRSLSAGESVRIVVPRSAEELEPVATDRVGVGVLGRGDDRVHARFSEDGGLMDDVTTIADDADLLTALEEEAESEDRFAMEERGAPAVPMRPGRGSERPRRRRTSRGRAFRTDPSGAMLRPGPDRGR